MGGGEPVLRALFEATANDLAERAREMRGPVLEGRRVLVQDRAHGVRRRRSGEGPAPGEHLVQDAAEREDVGAVVGRVPPYLLGGHVAHRAHNHPRARSVRHRRRRLGLGLLQRRSQLRETEVQDLDDTGARDEHVPRFEVAVHDPLFVRRGQALGDLDADLDGLPGRQAAAHEKLAQRLAFKQLGDEERRALVRPDVVDRQNVRVVESACRLRFHLKTPKPVGVGCKLPGQNLDRDVTLEARVTGLVDLAHPPSADKGENLVRTQANARLH